ncbi:acyltransferase [Niveibacterium sp. 24ML]|uniref:LpxL/LpxP family acyltransferase n=1 Tax=Niveibacterium sp. 24ML TaxID=2985512 RepID=UPI00226E51F0|nr:acyltransferase [Niveibacterium sp. 24ML]MCX9157657.1 acyltransferase [Niveibacterium sp. 24ML]
MSTGARHWAQIDEVGFVFGMRLMYRLQRVLGRLPFLIALYPVVFAYWLTAGSARRASQAYLARLRACGVEPGRFASLRHFIAFADCMLDKLMVWNGGLDPANCIVEGAELCAEAFRAGRGGLIVTAHLGNFEASRALASSYHDSRKIHVLVHTRHAARFNRLMAELNPDSQLNLIQVTELDPAMAMFLAERVAEGDFIVMTGDRVPVTQDAGIVDAPFFGEAAPFPIGPWVLAAVLGVPVFLMWPTAEGKGFRVRFELFRDRVVLPRRNREAALQPLVAAFAARLEAQTRRTPLQWFNFFDFWARPTRTT